MNSEVYKRKVDTRDEFLDPVVGVAAPLPPTPPPKKKSEDQLKRITSDLRTRVAKCTEVGGGIFQHSS